MHTQVDGNQQDVFGKDVHLFGPAADSGVAAAAQFGIEEGAERVDGRQLGPFAPFHQQIHVKIDHLKKGKTSNLNLPNQSNIEEFLKSTCNMSF